jgi:N-acetylglucosamine kinase-like BadF-type ATPase
MGYLIGMDGGGTRTTAWLADERGRILAKAVSGPSNPLKAGFESAEREILRAARAAARKARIKFARFDAVVIGLAGTDRPPVHNQLLRWLNRRIPARHHLLTSDAAIALAAAIPPARDEPGIIVVSGTGSIAFARDRRTETHRAGGWGTLFDDAGSGYDIGRKAVTAALRALDGRGRPTRLQKSLCRPLGIRKLTDVVWKPPSPRKMAALVPSVLRAAALGDAVAERILSDAGSDLAELAIALASRLRWRRRDFAVVCAGGVFRSSREVRRAFLHALRRKYPGARVALLRRPSVLGAIALGRTLAADAPRNRS